MAGQVHRLSVSQLYGIIFALYLKTKCFGVASDDEVNKRYFRSREAP